MNRYFFTVISVQNVIVLFFISESNYLSIYAVLDNGISIFV